MTTSQRDYAKSNMKKRLRGKALGRRELNTNCKCKLQTANCNRATNETENRATNTNYERTELQTQTNTKIFQTTFRNSLNPNLYHLKSPLIRWFFTLNPSP